uniref:Uncharacterized protein n=1 Tax=Geospiza parvula TaxID=87175 RepID=A0A8U8CFW8_GEOPR
MQTPKYCICRECPDEGGMVRRTPIYQNITLYYITSKLNLPSTQLCTPVLRIL